MLLIIRLELRQVNALNPWVGLGLSSSLQLFAWNRVCDILSTRDKLDP